MQLGKTPSKFSSFKGNTTFEVLTEVSKNQKLNSWFSSEKSSHGQDVLNRYTNFYDVLKTDNTRMDFYSI